jgi:threonine/homoserine/homoserine lactone efflux protein
MDVRLTEASDGRPGWSLFKDGLLSAVTNPKALLFFAAFLPQFIDPHRNLFVQFAVMAATFGTTEFFYELMVAHAAHRISGLLRRVGRKFNRACGGIFIAIGAAMPLR